jgi:hypothetical protein
MTHSTLFTGHWRITEMELWDQDAIDLLGPAALVIGEDGLGTMSFIAVQGQIDCRFGQRDGQDAVEFTWSGDDDGDERCGRAWAIAVDHDTLCGRFYFHCGDDSGFVAKRGNGPVR